MLKAKILLSAIVFAVIFSLAAFGNYRMARQIPGGASATPVKIYSVRSSHSPADERDGSHPFSPREYVRIIQRIQ